MEYVGTRMTRTEKEFGANKRTADKLTPVYHKVNVDALQKHCLTIPYHQQSQYIMEVTNIDEWANAFSSA